MKSKLLKNLFIVILTLSYTAHAVLIEDNLDDYLYLHSASNDISGYFDMTGQEYEHAWVTLSFVDDTYLFAEQYPFNDQRPVDEGELDNSLGVQSFYRHSAAQGSFFFDGWEQVTHIQQDIIETAYISFADIAGNISIDYMETHTIGFHEHNEPGHDWSLGRRDCHLPCQFFNLQHSVETSGYTGYFTVRERLSKGLIDHVLVDGKLEFDIGVVSGDFYLASATIRTIPEPASLGLFLLALFGLVSVQRKNSRTLSDC
ncbi:PEP-CTERM sorting domain-containing protein [Thalassomonas actiniarum]|uniref:PEP-CTERM sorting domain-containing protein n=1 Tax=Thalassomonas actiniarum TaxID=485447 RepID=A0AAF0C3C3_9GAMM|nr:PEP-CTERM sorting domain-containing protein [Thalassomonas actiniarum]WDD99427.1 PEP-CTERM sorting domain-containing protein [Thalassomonas actiniarum]